MGGESCTADLADIMGVEVGAAQPFRPVIHCGAHYKDRLVKNVIMENNDVLQPILWQMSRDALMDVWVSGIARLPANLMRLSWSRAWQQLIMRNVLDAVHVLRSVPEI